MPRALLITLLFAMPWGAVRAAPQDRPAAKLKVAVSIPPQVYFVERVGGPRVQVDVLVGPGQSPHTFEPTAKLISALSDARVYFRIGVDFEDALVPRLAGMFKNLKIVDTRAGVPLRKFTADERAAESHDGHDEHAEGRPDPHIWLNPLYVKTQARTICEILAALDPPQAEEYRRNLAGFERDLDRVHARIRESLAPLKGRAIFVFHPAFGYFTDAYELKQIPVEIEGKEPTARQIARVIDAAKAAQVKVIFVQPQFSARAATAVADAIGGAVVPMDDLSRDYLGSLERMADQIKAALAKGGP